MPKVGFIYSFVYFYLVAAKWKAHHYQNNSIYNLSYCPA